MTIPNIDTLEPGQKRTFKVGGVDYEADANGIRPVREARMEEANKPIERETIMISKKVSAKTAAEMEGGRRAMERHANKRQAELDAGHHRESFAEQNRRLDGGCKPVFVPKDFVQRFTEMKQVGKTHLPSVGEPTSEE